MDKRVVMTVTNLVLFQVGWFACVLSGAAQRPWIGAVIATTIVGVHLLRAHVREAELNVRAFKRMWRTAAALERDGMGAILESHDAMGSLEMREAMETRAFE